MPGRDVLRVGILKKGELKFDGGIERLGFSDQIRSDQVGFRPGPAKIS